MRDAKPPHLCRKSEGKNFFFLPRNFTPSVLEGGEKLDKLKRPILF